MNTPSIPKSPLVYIGYIPFFGRIIRSIIIHYFRHTRLAYIVVKRMGALFLVDQHNKVDRSLLVKGEWEPQQISRLMQLINLHRPKNAPSIFLDIGAHGGLYSIILGKTEEFQQIFSFEPDRINMAQLYANLFINGLADKISVVQAAAANRSGTAGFVSCRGRDRGLSHLLADPGATADTTVEAVRIDDMIKQKDAFIAAKIDVEGYEMGVLEGMEDLIKSNSCVLQIEIKDDLDAILELTRSYGLQPAGQVHYDYYFVKP
ncbi:MAG: FkbM family methyltransferase [Rhodomicrobium sp.]